MLLLTWSDKAGFAQVARFDIVTSETWEAIMSITSHPVEEGADVVDHARPEPERITIEGYVSNKPTWSNPGVEFYMSWQGVELKIPEKAGGPPALSPGSISQAVGSAIGSAANSVLGRKNPVLRASVLKPSGDMPQRDRAMFDKLTEARNARVLVKVYSRLAEIDSMLIERVAVPRTPENGNGSLFQIDLVKIRIAKSELVTDPLEARGMLNQVKGSKAAQASANDAKKAEKAQELASGLWQGGAGVGLWR